MQNYIVKNNKSYRIGPLSFRYVEVDIGNDEIIKGGGFYISSKCFLTIGYCNQPWIDEEGRPYNFKVDGDILFLRKLAFSLK
ncbi:hypothetical protein NCCP2716_27590 [Sporosarcina sp. NCCP-2716]|nr:hypothetical protein NCCP2716_27590 [Sporosarcina sp. NCCP-2716]